jgi:hypothetical protein
MEIMFVTLIVKIIGVAIAVALILFGVMRYGEKKEALAEAKAKMEAKEKNQKTASSILQEQEDIRSGKYDLANDPDKLL